MLCILESLAKTLLHPIAILQIGHSFFLPLTEVVMQLEQNLCIQVMTNTGSRITSKHIGHLQTSRKVSNASYDIVLSPVLALLLLVLSLGLHAFW
jgi:hypothetical protein